MIVSESSGFHSFVSGPLVLITITHVRTEPGCFVPYLASTVRFQTKTSHSSGAGTVGLTTGSLSGLL